MGGSSGRDTDLVLVMKGGEKIEVRKPQCIAYEWPGSRNWAINVPAELAGATNHSIGRNDTFAIMKSFDFSGYDDNKQLIRRVYVKNVYGVQPLPNLYLYDWIINQVKSKVGM
jgi:hypothetical protein